MGWSGQWPGDWPIYDNPIDQFIYDPANIRYVHAPPLRLRLDNAHVNGEGKDSIEPGRSTVLRCELPWYRPVLDGIYAPQRLVIYRRENDGVNWGPWEKPYNGLMYIDGSVEYEPDGIFTIGVNEQTLNDEARLIVCPPLVRNNYYQYAAHVEGGGVHGTYLDYLSEVIYSETLLRYGHEDFPPHIDAPLVPRQTPVKAAHMLEMQERTNFLLAWYKKAQVQFSPIVAEITSLALWTQHVKEIRAALDKITPEPVEWLDIPANQPRADVMEQIREVIMSL